jgi:hypothetical protein
MSSTESLWKVLDDAAMQAQKSGRDGRLSYAAEIRAFADWIRKRHPLEPDSPTYIGASLVAAQLLAEADRAEAG